MATNKASRDPEVISPTDKRRAREIVELLKDELLLSLDSEGVQLGKDGPLTLLQIGTLDGHVYLFDVMLSEREQDKAFFRDTGLDAILASTEITKVIHSCSNDSAALYYQFGVHLDNVFDTQVAHLVIEEHKGRKLPTKLKLAEICTHYSENAQVYKGKDDMKMKWSKQVGNFWAIRPMTDEMIGYASCDVTVLIPEVHDTQKKYIDDNGLLQKYQQRVQEERDVHIDPEQKERRKLRQQHYRTEVLSDIDEKYPTEIDFNSISDDEKKAIEISSTKNLKDSSNKIKRLKQESINHNMVRIEQDLHAPDNFIPHIGTWSQVCESERYGDEASKQLAKSLKNRLLNMVLDDINTKYSTDMEVDLEYLTPLDRQVLMNIRPIGDNDKTYAERILTLHWKLKEKCLDEEIEKIETDPNDEVAVSLRQLNFYLRKDEVPIDIQRKAKRLKNFMEKKILEDIEEKLNTPETFCPHPSDWDKLGEVELCGEKSTKARARVLRQELSDIVLGDIEKRHSSDADIESINDLECHVLKNVRPIGADERTISDTIVTLHWKLVGKDIDEEMKQLEFDPNYEVSMSFGKLNFYLRKDKVPVDIQRKAKRLKNFMEKKILEDIEEKLNTPETFCTHQSDWDKLGEVERCGGKSTKERARVLRQELSYIILGEIEKKHSSDTDIESLNNLECHVLKNVRPIGDDEQTFSDTIVTLHWKLVGKGIDEDIEKLESDPNHEVGVSVGKLNFYLKNDEVPPRIKSRVETLRDRLVESISRKYDSVDDVAKLSRDEKSVIESLNPVDWADNELIVDMYWRIEYGKLCARFPRKTSAKEIQMSEGLKRKLNFLKTHKSVPGYLKQKANSILTQVPPSKK